MCACVCFLLFFTLVRHWCSVSLYLLQLSPGGRVCMCVLHCCLRCVYLVLVVCVRARIAVSRLQIKMCVCVVSYFFSFGVECVCVLTSS